MLVYLIYLIFLLGVFLYHVEMYISSNIDTIKLLITNLH